MDIHSLFEILKFSLPAVGLVAVVLGSLTEVRREGPDGEKRLTFYGRVLTGLTVFSAFVSLFAAGLEIIIKQGDAARADVEMNNAKLKAIIDAQIAQKKEAKEQADKQLDRDNAAARAREVKAGLVDQKLALLSAAAEAQHRDALISHSLAKAAETSLADTQQALAEFSRINYPLRKITATLAVELNLSGPEIEKYWEWLKEREVPFKIGEHRANPNKAIELSLEDRSHSPNQFVQYAAMATRVELAFLPPGAAQHAAPLRTATVGHELHTHRWRLDKIASFTILLEKPRVTADLTRRVITVYYEMTMEPEHVGEFGGQKLSISDAMRLTPILRIERYTTRFPRGPDQIVHLTLAFNDDGVFGLGNGQEAPFDNKVAYVLGR